MTEKIVLKIDNAEKYYNRGRDNEIHVMNGISLSLPESGMVAIFGKSGCGKTTLLNAVGGLDSIASGSIEIFGENLTHNPDVIRNRYTGFIFQNYNLNIGETVFENVADALRLCGVEDEQVIRTRVMAALADVDMDKFRERTPDTLSGGQQQRVAIARAIVKSPAIILADEPTGNLDENNTVMVMDILKEISRTRLVLLVTHEANLVDFYCDRVIEMADGHIVNDRINTGANGYVQRNKNDIFLGDLEKHEGELPGVSLTSYGELPADRPVRIRLVNEGGRLFLTCDTPGVRFLDETSEVHLREGSFRAAAGMAHVNRDGRTSNIAALKPLDSGNGHYGRLYHFRNALAMAWRENYSPRKKKGKRFLRGCLILLAFVMVFTAASAAVNLKGYVTFKKDYDPNLFFIPIDAGKDGTDFKYDYNALVGDLIGQNGIDGAQLCSRPTDARVSVSFRTAAFMTAQSEPTLSAQGYTLPVSMLKNAELVCGTAELGNASEILVTTAMADDLLESSDASYINSYEDLLGLVTSSSEQRRIVGIVRSTEKAYLLTDIAAAQSALHGSVYLPITPLSQQTRYTGELQSGEIAVLGGEYKTGEKLTIFGRSFTVREAVESWENPNLYTQYVTEIKGEKMLSLSDYCKQSDSDLTEEQLCCEYLFEYFPRYLAEYLQLGGERTDPSLWLYAEKGSMASLYNFLYANKFDVFDLASLTDGQNLFAEAESLWQAYSFRTENGYWPSAAELAFCQYESWKPEYEYMLQMYIDSYYEDTSRSGSGATVVMRDDDYIALASSAGATDTRLNEGAFTKEQDGDTVYYSAYMMIHASDRDDAEAYLQKTFGSDLITRKDLLRQYAGNLTTNFTTAGITLIVILAFMCLCVFFIMRSSFMSRVREVGILRAIGVSKKNLLYRFLIETVLLTVLTVLIGFVAASVSMIYLSGAAFFNQILYFPLWLAGCLLVVVLAACILFGLLPAVLLLRSTPSEILSKYDI
jgi:ABC-type lipoprotein export system ATPase subunit